MKSFAPPAPSARPPAAALAAPGRFAIVLTSVFALGACASSPELKVRPLEGDLADRFMALQESMFALIVRAKSSAEAASAIEQYCADEAPAIDKIAADAAAVGEGPEAEAFVKEVARRSEALIDRASEALEDRVDMMNDGQVLMAMAKCRGEISEPPSGDRVEPDAEPIE